MQEFREFINRGNVIDLAVAVVLGAAFKPIIDALVQRVLMPIIGMLVGEPNFSQLGTFACSPGGDPELGIQVGDQVCSGSVGAVLTEMVAFVLVALALFLVVKAYNRMQRADAVEPEPEADPEDIVLLREIRDRLGSS